MIHVRVLDLGGQGRIDGDAAIGGKRDKALREIAIARCQRGADLPFRDVTIERAIERPIADLDRVIGRGEAVSRRNAGVDERNRDEREDGGAHERNSRMPDHPTQSRLAHSSVPVLCVR